MPNSLRRLIAKKKLAITSPPPAVVSIKESMEIEQRPPKKPNFPLIVALFAITIVVCLALGYLFLHHSAGHILPS